MKASNPNLEVDNNACLDKLEESLRKFDKRKHDISHEFANVVE